MTKNIILFGQMGSGKSTIADILVKDFGYIKASLGRKIHGECAMHGTHSRHEMQAYGQAMREIFGIDVWNQYLFNQLHNNPGRYMEYGRVIIDDGRQLNELSYWEARGFVSIGVTAYEQQRIERLEQRTGKTPTSEQLTHETEIQAAECVEMCDFIINNYDSIEDLRRSIGSRIFERM